MEVFVFMLALIYSSAVILILRLLYIISWPLGIIQRLSYSLRR